MLKAVSTLGCIFLVMIATHVPTQLGQLVVGILGGFALSYFIEKHTHKSLKVK